MGAIRLFLAFVVVIEHFDQQVLTPNSMPFNPAWSLYVNGGRAVLLFYVVSGFLISYVLHEKYRDNTAGALAFYRSRFLRIYPLWWTTLILAVVFDLWRHAPDPLPSNWLPAISLFGLDWIIPLRRFPDFDWSVLPNRVAIGWTLGAEVTFYLMAPAILRSTLMALVLLAASVLVRAIILVTVSRGPGFVNLTMFFFPATMMCFLLGHFSAVLSRRWPIGLAGSLGFLCAAGALSYRAVHQVTFDDGLSNLLPVCFALSLPGIFAASKDNRFLNFLGDLTYPLYLTHSLAIAALFWPLKERMSHWILPLFQSKSSVPILLIGLILATAIAVATHYLLEPLARFLVVRALAFPVKCGLVSVLRNGETETGHKSELPK